MGADLSRNCCNNDGTGERGGAASTVDEAQRAAILVRSRARGVQTMALDGHALAYCDNYAMNGGGGGKGGGGDAAALEAVAAQPTLVVIGGLGGWTTDTYADFAARARGELGQRVVTFDLPCHGHSAGFPNNHAVIPQHARATRALLEHLGLVAPEPDENGGGGDDGAAVAAPGRLESAAAGCVLHGWGMGWLIALEYVERYGLGGGAGGGAGVCGLVCEDSVPQMVMGGSWAGMGQTAAQLQGVFLGIAQDQVETLRGMFDSAVFFPGTDEMIADNWEVNARPGLEIMEWEALLLELISCCATTHGNSLAKFRAAGAAVLILSGDESFYREAEKAKMRELIGRGATLVNLKFTGHAVCQKSPDALLKHYGDFAHKLQIREASSRRFSETTSRLAPGPSQSDSP